jgi:hypothetical protein
VEEDFYLPPSRRAKNANLDAYVRLANWNDCVTRLARSADTPVVIVVKATLELLDGHLSRSTVTSEVVDLMEAVLRKRPALSPFSNARSWRVGPVFVS